MSLPCRLISLLNSSQLTSFPLSRKDELIENIHNLQPARLCTAFFKREATNIMQQLELIVAYVKVLKTSPEAAKTVC